MRIIHMAASQPKTIYVDQQEKTIFLACEIKKNVELQWFHNNTKITTSPPYVLTWNKKDAGEQGSVLMIRPLRGHASDGVYDCVANIGHKLTKATVHIIVRESKDLRRANLSTSTINKLEKFSVVVSTKII